MDAYHRERQKYAQQLYRDKKYEEAVKCLTGILVQYHDALDVLDNRAAAYIKLSDHSSALKDGKKMINASKTDPKGYLRTGQILQLMNKTDLAMDIYDYGLKNLKLSSTEAYNAVLAVRNKLASRTVPTAACDPLTKLPFEILGLILGHLSLRERTRVTGVSKAWRSTLEAMDSLWRNLDLSEAPRGMPQMAIKAILRRTHGGATAATIPKTLFNTSEILKLIMQSSRTRLTSLELSAALTAGPLTELIISAVNLSTLIVGESSSNAPRWRDTTLHAVSELMSKCKNLKHVEFRSLCGTHHVVDWEGDYPKLQTVKLSLVHVERSSSVNLVRPAVLFSKAPNIVNLSLNGWKCNHVLHQLIDFSVLSKLERLDLTQTNLSRFPPLPPSITHLSFTALHKDLFSSAESQAAISKANGSLKNLRSLIILAARYLYLPQLEAILESNKGNLEHLSIPSFVSQNAFQENALVDLIRDGYARSLQEVDLIDTGLDDATIECISVECLQLTSLNAGWNPKVSGVGVKRIVQKGGRKLEKLGLNNCTGVGIDAVEWARSVGVDVEYGNPDYLRGGRKVRLG